MLETSTPQPQTNVMEDFVFGGIEADEQLLLADARNLWRGIRHQYAIEPLDPQPDEPVTVTVFVGPDVNVDQVCLYITVDGSEPAGSRGVAENGFVVPLQLVDKLDSNPYSVELPAAITQALQRRTELAALQRTVGLQKEDPTIAELLKNHGYATGQFGKNHLGDLNQYLPTVHGFDEFFGNLYHLNAEEEPEQRTYPGEEFRKKFGPRTRMTAAPLLFTFRMCGQAASNSSRLVNGME